LYVDDGVSGTIPLDERPEGRRLLDDAKEGKFDTVLIYKLDRLSRSARLTLNAVHSLEQSSVKIKSMTEPFDTADSSGRFLLTILAGVADLERSNFLERSMIGKNRLARVDGRHIGGLTPFGYVVVDKFLHICEEEADIVRQIYDLVVNHGWTTVKIASHLNALGVATAYHRGRAPRRKTEVRTTWLPSRISNVIKQTIYKGIHVYGKRAVKEREQIFRLVPPIVSEEIWDRAQLVMKKNLAFSTAGRSRFYLLRSLVVCGLCGYHYAGHFSGGFRRYRCNGKTRYSLKYEGMCKNPGVSADLLEQMVWDKVEGYILNPASVAETYSVSLEGESKKSLSLQKERVKIQEALHEREAEYSMLLDMILKRSIERSVGEEKLKGISEATISLKGRMKEITAALSSVAVKTTSFLGAEEKLRRYAERLDRDDPEVRRQIVGELIEKIVITVEDGEAVATVHFAFSPEGDDSDKFKLHAVPLLHGACTTELRLPIGRVYGAVAANRVPESRPADTGSRQHQPDDVADS
jgi:site-specific DNA recombinase